MNQMHESLNLFKEVAGNPIFKKTPMFVFLNKKDLFEEVITTVVRNPGDLVWPGSACL